MIWHITAIISGFAVFTVSVIVLVYKYLMKDNSRRYKRTIAILSVLLGKMAIIRYLQTQIVPISLMIQGQHLYAIYEMLTKTVVNIANFMVPGTLSFHHLRFNSLSSH